MAETLVLFFTDNSASRWDPEQRNKWVVGRLDGWIDSFSLDGEVLDASYHDTLDEAIECLRSKQKEREP
jgi:hypothetical protein